METPIWNGVVYRGKIKHAVTCRQFGPLPPCSPAAPFEPIASAVYAVRKEV